MFRKIALVNPPIVFTFNRSMTTFACETQACNPLRAFCNPAPNLYIVENIVHCPVGDLVLLLGACASYRASRRLCGPFQTVSRDSNQFTPLTIEVQAPYLTGIGEIGQRAERCLADNKLMEDLM